MAIEFGCPSCGGTLRVEDDAVGQVVRCGGCMTMLRVPDSASPPPSFPGSPSSRFPDEIQPIVRVLPLTALNDAMRAIMNDGSGFGALPYPLLILCIWGGISFALALRFFRWQ